MLSLTGAAGAQCPQAPATPNHNRLPHHLHSCPTRRSSDLTVRARHRAGNRSHLTPRAERAQGPHAQTTRVNCRHLLDKYVSHRPHTTEPTKASSQLFAALNLPEVTSNGEVEGPDDHA